MAGLERLSFDLLQTRAKFGLGFLVVLLLLIVFDRTSILVNDKEAEFRVIQDKLNNIHALEQQDDLLRHIEESERILAAYKLLLLNDDTIGLNVASLQSIVIETLTECGIESIVADIDYEVYSQAPVLYAYNVSVRGRDTQNVFPLCLSELALLDVGIIISDLTWRRGGAIQLKLKAYSAELASESD